MTAYLVFGALRAKTIVPSQMVAVSERAWRAEGSRMFIEPRRAVSVDELMRGMIVQSGNDASIALAELVGRQRGGVRRADERGGRAPRHDQHAFHQRDRPVQSAALLDRPRTSPSSRPR